MTKEELVKLIQDNLTISVEEIKAKISDEMVTEFEAKLKEYVKKTESKIIVPGETKSNTWKSFGEQLQAVASTVIEQKMDNRLIKAPSGLNEGTGAEGGFLVQPEFSNELIKLTHETGILIKDVRVIPISGIQIVLNALKETSRANGSRWGGIQAYWTSEAGSMTKSKPEFRQIDLKLNKLTGLCYSTEELLADASALEAVVKEGFGEEFGFKIDDAIINGTGVGMPKGVLNSGAYISVDKDSGQTADTFTATNAMNIWTRMPAKNRAKAKWYMNQDVETQLFQLNLKLGTGAVPVFLPPTGLTKAINGTLFGRPIEFIEQAATLGDVGDVMLLDLKEYILIRKRTGVDAASSVHVRFLYDETTFRFIYRVDGQPIWNNALTSFKGSVTRSPYVGVAERA